MIRSLFLFTTGITLFLFATTKLSTEMKPLFTVRIRRYIRFSVAKPLYGLFAGIAATILFQSSSATTLFTIGLVSAGLISFVHSLGIILGADIGTTLTVQLVVWNVTTISPLFIFTGALLFFTGKERWKLGGECLFYFGLIFFGLSLVGEGATLLKHNGSLITYFQKVRNPFVGIAIGAVFTAIVHTSAVPISTVIILSQQGLITIENGLPIVLGANIGTTVTALMGSMVANISGKRSAISHLVFKCAGVIVSLLFFPLYVSLLTYLSSSVPQQVAMSHFLFNLGITLMFIFVLRPFAAFVERLVPGVEGTLPLWPEYLDEACLTRAEDALECVKKELQREIDLSIRMFHGSLALVEKFSETGKKDVVYVEMVVDNLQAEITHFLWNVSCGDLSPALSRKLFAFTTMVYDIERIGDHAINLTDLAESKHRRKTAFTKAAEFELKEIEMLVADSLVDAAAIIERKDAGKIRAIFERSEEVKLKVANATDQHLERFFQKACVAEAGPIFVDMLINLERLSHRCQSIAAHVEDLEGE